MSAMKQENDGEVNKESVTGEEESEFVRICQSFQSADEGAV